MKKLALLSDGWRRNIVYAWPDGIMQKIRKENLDISLFQYNCFGNWSHDKNHNVGEYNIFNLPNLNFYDGIIIDATNISDDIVVKKIIEKIKNSGKPAVSIGREFEGIHYVGIDNKKPIKEIVEHLIEKHNCKNFVFAAGPIDNFENNQRIAAFKESLLKHNIFFTDEDIIYGDYEYQTGERVISKFIEKKRAFPDVFVCANDNIAAGICNAATTYGYNVPKDFLVTGFDNLDKAAYYKPQITTVDVNRETIGQKALDVILDLWDKKDVPKFSFVDAKVIFSESCGCENENKVDYRAYLKDFIDSNCNKESFDNRMSMLEGDVINEEDVDGMFDVISKYIANIDLDGYYIIVDKGVYDTSMGTTFPKNTYNYKNLQVAVAIEQNEKFHFDSVTDLTEHIIEKLSSNHFLFVPLHFGDEAVGFMIFKNPTFLRKWSNLYDMHMGIVNAFQNIFRKRQLENAMHRLEDVYNKDQLTGIYNRIAFASLIEPAFLSNTNKGIVSAVLFTDVDDFKKLNDTYGHEYGDRTLRTIAKTLNKYLPDGGFACRYGGDEFVVVYPYANINNLNDYIENVNDDLKDNNVHTSFGFCITDANSQMTLSEYVSLADSHMYVEKKKHKQ